MTKHIVFVEPAFPANQREFTRALHEVGARVTGIGERPPEYLGEQLQSWLDGYEQVPSVVHEASLLETVKKIQSQGPIDRLEATVEAHIMPVARVREECGIPGTSVKTAWLCRDKPSMKDALRDAGVPCAQSTSADSAKEVRDFADKVGFPLILKPRSGAGASGTYKVNDANELEHAMTELEVEKGYSIAVEEFIEGHEGFYDTMTINGQIAHEFATHYYPNVLDAMRTREVSPYFITTNRLDSTGYQELRELGRKVIEALEIETSATHMEWFFGPKGLKFSEIGCRPPGVGGWDVYSAANEMDLYKEWAMGVTHGHPSQQPSRRFSAAMISFRPTQDGTVSRYDGVDEVMERYGDCIVTHHFPPPGSPATPVEGGYMANAWMRVRHPDYDELRGILGSISDTIRIHAE